MYSEKERGGGNFNYIIIIAYYEESVKDAIQSADVMPYTYKYLLTVEEIIMIMILISLGSPHSVIVEKQREMIDWCPVIALSYTHIEEETARWYKVLNCTSTKQRNATAR